MRNEPKATGDFETRSARDLKKCGAYVYSLHRTTSVMCFAFRLPYWAPGRTGLWHPAYPHLGIEEEGREDLQEFFCWIALGGLFEAHNAFFERCIWENICVPRLGWPRVPHGQWCCSAAKCSVHGLPRDLDRAGAVLGCLELKDKAGAALMLKLCKPRKPLKAEREAWVDAGSPLLWRESREDFECLWTYCRRDVLAEEDISSHLDDLSDLEQRVWQMDQDMNWRGILADVELAQSALYLVERYTARCNEELCAITGGRVQTAGQREQFKDWCSINGLRLEDTQGVTLDRVLKMKGLAPEIARAVFIVRDVNRTSVAKYKVVLQRAPADGRLRDLLMYSGAGTGRWTGKGFQPHNLVKGKFTTHEAIRNVCDVIKGRDLDYLVAMYGDRVMEVLSWAMRGVLVASEGRELLVADFAAIEARVVLWLARQMSALEVFERGECIYCDMATGVYGYTVTKKVNNDNNERQFGKQAILGLGFEMGFVKFLLTCRKYDIVFTEAMARRIVGEGWDQHVEKIASYFSSVPGRRQALVDEGFDVDEVMHELVLMRHTVMTYRARYAEVAQMWRDQEDAAIAAVRSPGRRVTVERGRNTWVVEGRFLKCYLPSGRPLHYCDPKVVMKRLPWSKTERKASLTFMGMSSKTNQWVRKDAYGGLLVENITQATARDLMAEAMVRMDDDPRLDVVMSVHDEVICEADPGTCTVHEFERSMAWTPAWAKGCPVDAEGWAGPRYRK